MSFATGYIIPEKTFNQKFKPRKKRKNKDVIKVVANDGSKKKKRVRFNLPDEENESSDGSTSESDSSVDEEKESAPSQNKSVNKLTQKIEKKATEMKKLINTVVKKKLPHEIKYKQTKITDYFSPILKETYTDAKIVERIPVNKRLNAFEVLNFMKTKTPTIQYNKHSGEVIITGKTIPGSNIMDILKFIFGISSGITTTYQVNKVPEETRELAETMRSIPRGADRFFLEMASYVPKDTNPQEFFNMDNSRVNSILRWHFLILKKGKDKHIKSLLEKEDKQSAKRRREEELKCIEEEALIEDEDDDELERNVYSPAPFITPTTTLKRSTSPLVKSPLRTRPARDGSFTARDGSFSTSPIQEFFDRTGKVLGSWMRGSPRDPPLLPKKEEEEEEDDDADSYQSDNDEGPDTGAVRDPRDVSYDHLGEEVCDDDLLLRDQHRVMDLINAESQIKKSIA